MGHLRITCGRWKLMKGSCKRDYTMITTPTQIRIEENARAAELLEGFVLNLSDAMRYRSTTLWTKRGFYLPLA